MGDLLITGGTLISDGKQEQADLYLKDGRIKNIGPSLAHSGNARVIEADGKWILPGLIDDQVHFREPGLTHKACIATEARAAVAGGVTSFFEMPNVSPPTLGLERLEEKRAIARQKSAANFAFFLGASNDNIEAVKAADPTRIAGVKVFMGSSTGNMLVDEEKALEQIFRHAPTTIATHCEDTPTILENERLAREKYGEKVPFWEHPNIRSREACLLSSTLATELAKREKARLHVLHISTEEELNLFTPGDSRITAEACVHHLWFEESSYTTLGSQIKCNPAIKQLSDREAVRKAVKDGRISVLATDHAPHTWEEKQGTYFHAPSGLPLVQHTLLLMLEMVKQNCFSIETMVERACHAPARIFDVIDRGHLREGYWADLVIVNPGTETVVNNTELYSKCAWSPFAGERFSHRIEQTLVSGISAYENGKVQEDCQGQAVEFAKDRR
jgi:dihydroorotase